MIHEQSPDIAQGVDQSFDAQRGAVDPLDLIGAGDQGMMFGYASNETRRLCPCRITWQAVWRSALPRCAMTERCRTCVPDGKTQVTVRYENDQPVAVETIVISTQHAPEIESMDHISADLIEHVIAPVMMPRASLGATPPSM